MTDNLFVVTRKDNYIGLLPLTRLLVSDPNTLISDVMDTEREAIPADLDETDVANLFERNDWVSAPVINQEGRLVGRITIDDVVDVIREEADHSLMRMAGLDEDEDTFSEGRCGSCHDGRMPDEYGMCNCDDDVNNYEIVLLNDGVYDCVTGEDECGDNCVQPLALTPTQVNAEQPTLAQLKALFESEGGCGEGANSDTVNLCGTGTSWNADTSSCD